MPAINLTRNFQNITPEQLPSALESIVRDLEDQLAAHPSTVVRLTEQDALPEGMKPGTIIYDVSSGSLVTQIWNGKAFIT